MHLSACGENIDPAMVYFLKQQTSRAGVGACCYASVPLSATLPAGPYLLHDFYAISLGEKRKISCLAGQGHANAILNTSLQIQQRTRTASLPAA